MVGVTIKDVCKTFGKVNAVAHLNADIKPGEFFTFLGPSGCGKTTSLRMIAGFIYPTAGSIYFNDEDMTFLAPNKRNIGMVFQSYALFPHLTVGENVAFGLKIRKFSRKEIDMKVEKALEVVSLAGLSKRRIHQLSGGQQQRVALARAIVIEPSILLLDEPLSNLDAKLREDTRTEIKRIQMELGITTLYVTHDQSEAMALSDKIMVMKGGEVQQTGTPYDVFYNPANVFVAQFIGKSNIIGASVENAEDGRITYRTDIGVALTGFVKNVNTNVDISGGARVKLALRPEAFRAGTGFSSNLLKGVVEMSEFTGVTVNYLIKMGGSVIKACFSDEPGSVTDMGQEITLHYPENAVFAIENGEVENS